MAPRPTVVGGFLILLVMVVSTGCANRIDQIYYIGVFDPQEQLPPSMYRITVQGESSALSQVSFASGWVPAELVDSLQSSINQNLETGQTDITSGSQLSRLKTGRRLIQFGPEGFREAPADHRLVVVMGASPEKFFQAVDESLGVVAEVKDEQRNAELHRALFEALGHLKEQQRRLAEIEKDLAVEAQSEKDS
jgi:hypothetical protein